MMPYIDARYVSVEIDVTSSTRLHQKVYYCKGHNFYSFEEVLTYSLKYRCHISFQTTIQLVTRKPDVIKPTPAPKTFYVHTPFGPVYYRRNFPTYHIWKETWLNCGTKCCTFHKSYKFSELKKKYYTEINRYRRFVYLSPLIVHPKLTRLAQNRASYMAQHFVLQSDENQRYDEVIGKVRSTILINFIRILFNDAWFHNPYFSRISATRRDFARIMSQNQKFIGVGMAERFGHVFICIKFTPKSWSEIK
uniref:SCP domain-containing protein n=1 Tax=Strongyloides papillosus TaxID=174720 RepID=A0A0N5BLP9_STREA